MTVPIDKLEAGMELAADVNNADQLLLLGKGTVLNQPHLRMLKTWGIERVAIVGEAIPDEASPFEAELPPEILRQAVDEVDRRFRFVRTSIPAVTQIRELAIHRHARHLFADRAKTEPPPSQA
jgi:hypothetical protein